MDVERCVVIGELIQEIHPLGKIGEDLAAGLHQRGHGLEVDGGVGDGLAQPGLGLFIELIGGELLHILGVHPLELLNVEDGRGLGDTADVEGIHQLRKGKELLLGQRTSRRPAQKRHIVEHSLGEVAVGDEILIAGVAVALGHLVLGVAHDRGAVDVGGNLPAKGLV